MSASTRYASFLVRLWREEDSGRPGRLGDWQGEVEHIQSGRRWAFGRLDELVGFMRRMTEGAEVGGASAEG